MKTALIGAGNVAWHIGKALQEAGHEVVAVFSRTEAHRQELAQQLPAAIPVSSLDLRGTGAELVLLAVPDAALAEVTESLQLPAGAIVAHTSGSQPLAALQGIAGAQTGVFYPLQTFSKSKPLDFKTTPVLLEAADEQTLRTLQDVAATITQEVHVVDSAKRKQLHLAAVFACNFTNHLLGISQRILQQAELPVSLLQPLIRETIAKAEEQPPFQVQTGPAVRHDQNVVEEHLRMLQNQPTFQELYRQLTHSIQQQMQGSGKATE